MKEVIKKAVEEKFNIEAEWTESKKNNMIFDSLVLKNGDVCPTMHMNQILLNMENGQTTIEDVLDMVEDVLNHPIPYFDFKKILSKENILRTVRYAVVNTEKNEFRLQEIPSKKWEDLSVIYKIDVNDTGTIVVNNSMLIFRDITLEELDEAAYRNTMEQKFEINAFPTALFNQLPEEEIPEALFNMFLCSNEKYVDGASILLYPKYFAEIAEKEDSDLIILPCSIHEVIAMKAEEMKKETLQALVKDINENDLQATEYLSNSLYFYNKEEKTIRMIA